MHDDDSMRGASPGSLGFAGIAALRLLQGGACVGFQRVASALRTFFLLFFFFLSQVGQELLTCHSMTFQNGFAGNESVSELAQNTSSLRKVPNPGASGWATLLRVTGLPGLTGSEPQCLT